MDSGRWQTLWKLFDMALAQPQEQRLSWLREQCADDAELLAELQALLAAEAQRDAILDRAPTPPIRSERLHPGDQVDRYRIVRALGQGGMGSVYLAERTDGEYAQRAALKVIAPGHAHPVLVERFRRERQIMAALGHPGIARLLDGGHTQAGWPYLVMDFVDGVAIDAYCEQQRLGLGARLALLAQVCDAVDYAHRRLVVHRDLKPGNILVTAEGRPVLLDFGIAKLIDPDAADDATALSGLRPYTPGYAAPEQLEGEPVGVAADVYGLGILLFELLSGSRPFQPEPKEPLRLAEQIRSRQIPRLRDGAKADRRALSRMPELDWIARRALAADPDRRYADAADLARDLRALLEHRPVSARPESLLYRSGKFCRRHWVGVAMSVGFVLTVAGFGVQLHRESQRTRATLVQSSTERDRHQAAADFLRDLFITADSTQRGGAQISALELLDRGRQALAERTDLSAATRMTLLQTLAEVYRNSGRFDAALELLEQALSLSDEAERGERARLLADLGTVQQLRGEHAEAQATLESALALAEQPRLQALIQLRLGQALQSLGDHQSAGTAFQLAHQQLNAVDSERDPLLADAALRLGSWHWMGGRLAQAEDWYARALTMRRSAGDANLPELARALDAFGAVRHARGDFAAGVAMYREAVQLRRRVLGDGHSHTADSLSNLGAALYDMGDDAGAEQALNEALAIYQQVSAKANPAQARTLNNLALVRQRAGDRGQARELYQRALEINLASFGEKHRSVAANLNNLGLLSEQLGDLDAALDYLQRAIDAQEAALGAEHPSLAFALGNLGRVQLWREQPQTALALLGRAAEIRHRALDPEHPMHAETMSWLGYIHCVVLGEHGAGLELLERSLALREAQLEPGAVATEESRALLGCCRLAGGDLPGARADLRSALPELRKHWPQTSPSWQMLAEAASEAGIPAQ